MINVLGVKESAALNILLAVVDFLTQLLLVLVGAVLVFSPEMLVDNVDLGVAPTWSDFILAIPIGMIAYTGIETISNMAEEAKDERKTIPMAINRVRIAVFAIYFTLPAVALSALPVSATPDGEYQTLLGLTEEEGGYAGDPILGVVQQIDLGPLQVAGELYVGLLAATILFIATNAGIIGVSRLVYSMGIHRQVPDGLRQLHPRYRTPWIGILIFGGVAIVDAPPGPGGASSATCTRSARCCRSRSRTSRWRGCGRSRTTSRAPTAARATSRVRGYDVPLFAVVGGLGTVVAFVVVTALNPTVAIAGVGWLVLGRARLHRVPPPPGARPRLHPQGGDPAAGGRSRGGVRLRARAGRRGGYDEHVHRHRAQARGPQAPRHPRRSRS